MTTVYVLPAPCTDIYYHAPHPITIVHPKTPTMVSVLSCPGFNPALLPDRSFPSNQSPKGES